MSKDPFNPTVIGLSPLGNNQADVGISYQDSNGAVPSNDVNTLSDGALPGTDGQQREVPLVFDSITGTYSAPLSKVNQEERLMGLEVASLTQEDQRFLSACGFIQR